MKGWILYPDNFTAQIHVGDTVSWVNDDDAHHTITFGDGSIKSSENLKPGSQFSITFGKPGEYNYSCKYHKDLGMKGTITVIQK
jgi:plastocyanin